MRKPKGAVDGSFDAHFSRPLFSESRGQSVREEFYDFEGVLFGGYNGFHFHVLTAQCAASFIPGRMAIGWRDEAAHGTV